ncbi:MAG TPA: hypothetical protein DCZ94_21715 [Lentisphaeria bacterium]|nr:MAG: hypothetical protein A2X48_14645 [Lentisphaerae bacterium GWF2_49_21]HBC89564.1 hypothetical protein [Lentisphaeria bacterium]
MIVQKTDMTEIPLCCCDCKAMCKVPVECHYYNPQGDGEIKHIRPKTCPLLNLPSRAEAREILVGLMTDLKNNHAFMSLMK